jgi:hypothetical protein
MLTGLPLKRKEVTTPKVPPSPHGPEEVLVLLLAGLDEFAIG